MTENITSWKKERYRRQKLLARKKLRRQLIKDLEGWTSKLLQAYTQTNLLQSIVDKYKTNPESK